MRNFVIAVAALALAVPLVVGAQEGGNEADGWETRLDGGTDATSVLHFRTMGDGVHASTAGRGAAIFWQPNSMAKGDYTISASFTQTEPSGHPNAQGLFFGGSDLSGSNRRYSYFVIPQGGEFLVKKRMGNDTPTLVDWTAHDAINDLDDQGRSTNTLAVGSSSNSRHRSRCCKRAAPCGATGHRVLDSPCSVSHPCNRAGMTLGFPRKR